jgi:hypothetical protein
MLGKITKRRLNLSQFFIWCDIVVKAHATGVIPRNRHLYIYGEGTNGKTSFKRFLQSNFLVQIHSANHQFLTSVPETKPIHIYIFDEFNPKNHVGKNSLFRLNFFNNMMGEEIRDKDQYDDILKMARTECQESF